MWRMKTLPWTCAPEKPATRRFSLADTASVVTALPPPELGSAASDAAAAKWRRYVEAGDMLVPFALEAGGRPSDEAAAFLRTCGSAYTETHKSEDGDPALSPTGRLWQELSVLLHLGNAELILSANGR